MMQDIPESLTDTKFRTSDDPNSESFLAKQEIALTLRSAREKAGLSKEDVVESIKIDPNYLEWLESGQVDNFSAKTYYVGYLRSYSNHLGLDTQRMLDLAHKSIITSTRSNKINHNRKYQVFSEVNEKPTQETFSLLGFDKGKIIVLSVVSLLLVFILAVYVYFSNTPSIDEQYMDEDASLLFSNEPQTSTEADIFDSFTESSSPAVETQKQNLNILDDVRMRNDVSPLIDGGNTKNSPKIEDEYIPVQISPWPPANKSKKNKDAFKLIIAEDSWIRIHSALNGDIYYDSILKAGSEFEIPMADDLLLSVGNAGGVVLAVNGEDKYQISNKKGRVIKGIELNHENIVAQFKKIDD